jgi:RNA polymerase sigma-70 factor (ECF subfamily)
MTFRADRRHTDMTALQLTDETAFSGLVERHRRELQVHCYRMLGSFEEAEDLTQETFLRAWRSRDTYAGRAPLRAWLYRIATNACLDSLERRPRVPTESGEVLWLQPYPDELLEAIPAGDHSEPDALVVARETIELAFMVAIQHLPPRPRAVLILRDVLGWRAKDTAELLDTSVASVNSALQRARAGLKEHLPERRSEWAAGEPSAADRALVQRYMEFSEQGDAQALKAVMAEDMRFSMPPEPGVYVGRDTVMDVWTDGGFGDPERFGAVRCLLTSANRQPAVAYYVRPTGEERYRALAVDMLTIVDGEIAEIMAFDSSRFAALGLPDAL